MLTAKPSRQIPDLLSRSVDKNTGIFYINDKESVLK